MLEGVSERHTLFTFYTPKQLVALSAVRIAVATEAINCKIHFIVSFFVIAF
jgi:hypothetical protein